MVNKNFSRGKQVKNWYENHPIWVLLSITSFVLGLAVAAGTVFTFTVDIIENKILWKGVEQAKIESLAPTQTVEYFNSVLGEPNVKTASGDITRYIYKERGYWIESFSDSNSVVQVFDITACGDEGFYPAIKNNPVGEEIVLGKTKMIDTTAPKEWLWKEGDYGLKIHYFQRGATAPSYYYDEYYGGNPSNYQTVFTGHNELCGYLVFPDDIAKAMSDFSNKKPLNEEQVNRLRSNTIINTFAVTSPSFDLKLENLKNIGDGGLGVSYVDEGVLLPTKKIQSRNDESYKSAKDFDVIHFN
ncbi:hypothetical protein H7X68_01245 [Candidatus Saccharibacteria bacterium]|nr:hypothetical protein [Candidatus Saccharibacteria bacterium]